MRIFAILLAGAVGSRVDPCTRLCEFHGAAVCTGGSWTKPDNTCHAYLFRGPVENRDICYHTSATADVCPGTGVPITVADAQQLIPIRSSPTGAVPGGLDIHSYLMGHPGRRVPASAYPIDDLLVGHYLHVQRMASAAPTSTPSPVRDTPYPIDDLLVGQFLHGHGRR